MTGNEAPLHAMQGPVHAGAVSPDGRYVFTGLGWVPCQQPAPVAKSRTGIWVALGAAGVVGVAVAALVMSPSFREGFKAGYAASSGWTASALEDAIRENATLLASGSQLGVGDVECAESATDDWFVCSWRQQGESTRYIYTVETSGTRWQSSGAIIPGSASDLSRAEINSLIDGETARGQGLQSTPYSTGGEPDFSSHRYGVFWSDGVTVHTGPHTYTDSVTWLPQGTVVHVVCRTQGDPAPTGTGKTTTWWDRIDSPVSGFITDARIDSGGYPPSVPLC